MKIHSISPDAYILFFPFANPDTEMGAPFSPSSLNVKPIFVRTDIISVSTDKSKGGTGNWSATLSPRLDFMALIHPGSWCMIFMSDEDLNLTERPTANSGPDSGLKMLGIVRSIRCIESLDPNTGIRSVHYELAGDDFQSVLDAQVFINPELRPGGDKAASPLIDSLVYFDRAIEGAQSPDEMARFLIETLLGKKEILGENILDSRGGKAGGVYAIPPEVARRLTGKAAHNNLFINVLQLGLQKKLLGRLTHQPSLGSNYTLWSMLDSHSNKILNELYTDLIPEDINGEIRLVPTVVLRCIPFSSKNFVAKHNGRTFNVPSLKIRSGKRSDLKTHLYTSRFIGEDEIFAMNYGRSDHERFNFFFISNNFTNEHRLPAWSMATLLGNDSNPDSQQPIGDSNSVARNGLRPFFGSTSYAQLDVDDFVAHNLLARDMWHSAHRYRNGQVSIVGTKEHIPVGTNIQFKDRNWIAHVEGVSHSYSVAPSGHKSFRTRIAFVRLQKTDGTPIDYAKDALAEKSFYPTITSSEGNNLSKRMKQKKG